MKKIFLFLVLAFIASFFSVNAYATGGIEIHSGAAIDTVDDGSNQGTIVGSNSWLRIYPLTSNFQPSSAGSCSAGVTTCRGVRVQMTQYNGSSYHTNNCIIQYVNVGVIYIITPEVDLDWLDTSYTQNNTISFNVDKDNGNGTWTTTNSVSGVYATIDAAVCFGNMVDYTGQGDYLLEPTGGLYGWNGSAYVYLQALSLTSDMPTTHNGRPTFVQIAVTGISSSHWNNHSEWYNNGDTIGYSVVLVLHSGIYYDYYNTGISYGSNPSTGMYYINVYAPGDSNFMNSNNHLLQSGWFQNGYSHIDVGDYFFFNGDTDLYFRSRITGTMPYLKFGN